MMFLFFNDVSSRLMSISLKLVMINLKVHALRNDGWRRNFESKRRTFHAFLFSVELKKTRYVDGAPSIEQRRQNWLKHKQRSKSSDFSWRSGMWSPVEDSSRVLIIVPSPKRNKPPSREAQHKNKFKLPAFFQMDSGSSYESYEADRTGDTPALNSLAPTSGLQKIQQQNVYLPEGGGAHPRTKSSNQCLRESGLADRKNYLNVSSKPSVVHLSPITSSRNRAWMQDQPKSHSLDSSFDDSKESTGIHSTSSWRSSKNNSFKAIHEKSVKRKGDDAEPHELLGSSPSHLFYTYNQSSRTMERKSFKGSEFLSKQTSERIRAGSEEIKHLRMKNKSPEVRRSEMLAGSGTHLSPHQWTGKASGMEKRCTFSQQKSFSYDIPSLHPKQTIECRKKSEPIVGSSYRTPAARGKLFPGNQMFSLDVGNSSMQTRIDLQTLKSFSKKFQNPPRSKETPVEIFVSSTVETTPPRIALDTRRHHYCSQRSQSCETNSRNMLAIKRPSMSDQFLTASPSYSRRDYLTRHELQQFEIEIPASPYSVRVEKHQSPASRRNQFLNQKSQSCEIAYTKSDVKQILTQGKELRTLMGYPRLLRQLAKSDIGVEPIMEKDSSGSSKDAPEPPGPPAEPTQPRDTKKVMVATASITESETQIGDSAPKPFRRCKDVSPSREEVSGENKFHLLAKTKIQDQEGSAKKVSRSNTHASTKTEEGRLVSDGIVTWRRKLPEVDAAAAYERFERLMERNRSWIEEKKLNFVLQQQPHFGDGVKRKSYAQQKSFSYESEQHHHHHYHHGAYGGPQAAPQEHHRHVTLAKKRHQLVEFKKKSHSLDDKAACNREPLTSVRTTRNEVALRGDPIPLQIIEQVPLGGQRVQEVRESKGKPQKKLAMLHDMKALNEDTQHSPSDAGRLCRKRMSCRLSLGKLFSKLKPERVKK